MDPDNAATGRSDVTRGMLIGIAVAAVALLAIGLTVGFTRGGGSAGDQRGDTWAGRVLDEPREKPPLVLTDTNGDEYDLRAETDGQLTLLFFGYTNCPDVCPATMVSVSNALATLPADVRANTQLVFASVDPTRDTPEAIRAYLDSYDPSFVGLTGTPDELREAQAIADIPAATFDEPDDSGFYTVGHYSEMIAYSPDGAAHVIYPFGTRQSDWAGDLPRLARGEHP